MFPGANIEPRTSLKQTVALAGRKFRQMFIEDRGHQDPTILLTQC
jgi:hypothetical protein